MTIIEQMEMKKKNTDDMFNFKINQCISEIDVLEKELTILDKDSLNENSYLKWKLKLTEQTELKIKLNDFEFLYKFYKEENECQKV